MQGTHTFLAGQHQVGDAEPIAERLVRVFEDRPGDMGESVAVRSALLALPMVASLEPIDFGVTASRTNAAAPCNMKCDIELTILMCGLYLRWRMKETVPVVATAGATKRQIRRKLWRQQSEKSASTTLDFPRLKIDSGEIRMEPTLSITQAKRF